MTWVKDTINEEIEDLKELIETMRERVKGFSNYEDIAIGSCRIAKLEGKLEGLHEALLIIKSDERATEERAKGGDS